MAVLVRNDGMPISGLPEIGMMERKSSKLDLRGSTLPPLVGLSHMMKPPRSRGHLPLQGEVGSRSDPGGDLATYAESAERRDPHPAPLRVATLRRVGACGCVVQPSLSRLMQSTCGSGRYGALSSPKSRVDISWSASVTDAPTFAFVWREQGGPPEPRRTRTKRCLRCGRIGVIWDPLPSAPFV